MALIEVEIVDINAYLVWRGANPTSDSIIAKYSKGQIRTFLPISSTRIKEAGCFKIIPKRK